VSEAEKFFLRKEGVSYLKRAAQDIMESADFQSENIGDDAKDQTTAIKMRRQEAMKRARERYTEVCMEGNPPLPPLSSSWDCE